MILSSPSPAEYNDSQPFKVRPVSRAALTHRLRKMKSKMVKCKQCENYIVVSGVECEEVRSHIDGHTVKGHFEKNSR